jgi:hypothetical protein
VDTFLHASVPGITAKHAIVTPECRENRGKDGAFEEAARRLREEYDIILASPENSDVEFHVVLTVVRPSHTPKY